MSPAILFDLSFLAPKISKKNTCNAWDISSIIDLASPLSKIAS